MSESTTSSKTSICAEDEFQTPEVVLVEGAAKFRDGKRWKQRFCVLTKLSPAADCLQLQVYRDEKERARNGHTKASLSLQDFLAIESGFTLDKESQTLAIICAEVSVVLAFDNRERLIQWSVRIASNLGEGQHFLVQLASAPPKSKLTAGPLKLHVVHKRFCLTGGLPPTLQGYWELPHLRRYGIVDGRIVFEGGSRCGKGEGVHVLVPDPPQLHLIIDALDLSSKGHFARGPQTASTRRFASVTDSPRKSMSSRLSEMRSLHPAESTTNVSIQQTSNKIHPVTTTNVTISSTISPTPRESRSAEALCSQCAEVNVPPHLSTSQTGGGGHSLWLSSQSSSRCDLDTCDTLSIMEESIPHQVKPGLSSPTRNPGHQQLQIAKPLPSAMERCLSCMSKLGQQGQDILSPSWTMDLNVSNGSGGVGSGGQTSASATTSNFQQGSIGSGNSDRLSISSHGSSNGATEYYYDTPRSVLVAEMRRAARSHTPPGIFHNNHIQVQSASGSNCHYNSNGGGVGTGQQIVGHGGCHSPCRGSRNSGHITTGGGGIPCGQSHAGSVSCGSNCHCPQTHGRGTSESAHIYCNGAAEQNQKSHLASAKTSINLQTGSGIGPYENYDFPRNTQPLSLRSDQSVNGTSSIDWNKKLPMDRSSIATTASEQLSSASEFYDTPRQVCPCCAPTLPAGCPCCTSSSQNQYQQHQSSSVPHHHNNHHHFQNHNNSHNQNQTQQSHSHYGKPSCIIPPDPLENYDVPPHNNPHNNFLNEAPVVQMHQKQHPSTSISINGEGKMPLVTGSIPGRPNPNAIYAQVDKSKKTPRPLPIRQEEHFPTCDTHQPIYENRNAQLQHQPTYSNLSNNTKNATGKPPAQASALVQSEVQPSGHEHSNYVNLQFAESLQLYENAQDIASANQTKVLVHPEPQNVSKVPTEVEPEVKTQEKEPENEPKITVVENDYANANFNPEEIVKEAEVQKSQEVEMKSAESSLKEESSSGQSELRRGSGESDEAASLPLRRSSSVPCKGGHANRASASSSDSGVSGDGALFFEDASPSNDIASLCLHESLPRKSQRTSPGATNGKNTSTRSTPKPQESVDEVENIELDTQKQSQNQSPSHGDTLDPTLANRHYETIAEVESNSKDKQTVVVGNGGNNNSGVSVSSVILSNPVNPAVQAVKSAESSQRRNPLVSDANSSTSSGNSDMSDYIETLSSCSRGSADTLQSVNHAASGSGSVTNVNLNISASPKKSTSMKPRSGKEYFKIDRSMFKND